MDSRSSPLPPTGERPDGEAIAAVLAGDVAAFAVLVRRYNQTLFRACRAVLRDDAEAEDAVQAAWVSAYRALATFRADAPFRAWVTRIGIHEASARLRRRRRLTVVPLEANQMTSTDSPERAAFTEELGRLLERHVDALPDGLRAVLVLRDVIELDTAETARCLGITDEAVRVRLHRARQALSRALADDVGRAAPEVWRFDGARCDRVLAAVLAAIAAR